MSKCNVCGKDLENCDRIKCVDPIITVTWRATDWMEIAEALGHYYKLMDAFDHGGVHRTEEAKFAIMFSAVDEQLRQAMRSRADK